MPSTARIAINTNTPVAQIVDDVIVSQVGRHVQVLLPANTDYSLPWLTETSAYVRFPMIASSYTITLKSVPGDVGSTFTVPAGISCVPIMLAKPSTATTIFKSSAANLIVDLFYF